MKPTVQKGVYHLKTLLIMSTAYIAVFGSIQGFKAMLPLIREEYAISGAQAGLYSTFFYASGVAIAILSGRIVDHFGSRRSLIGGVLIIMTLMLSHTIAPAFTFLLILALFTGVGFSIVTPAINKGIIEMVDPSKRALSNGIVHGGGGLGGILGASLLPAIGELYGWRVAILVVSAIALFMALLLGIFFHPKKNGDASDEDTTPMLFRDALKRVLKDKRILLISIIGVMAGFSVGNITIHYTLFLTSDMAFTPTLAGATLSVFIAGGIIGNPLFGYMNDRFFNSNRRIGLFTLGLIVSGAFFLLAFVVFPLQSAAWMIMVLSFFFGFFAFAIMGMMFTTLGDVSGPKHMGMSTGLMLVFTRLSMMITPPIVGRIADARGNYQLSFIVIAIGVLLFASAFFILSRPFKEDFRNNSHVTPFNSSQ